MIDSTYIAFSDEGELISSTVEALLAATSWSGPKHGVGEQHAKTHAVLRRELTVPANLQPSASSRQECRRPPTTMRRAHD